MAVLKHTLPSLMAPSSLAITSYSSTTLHTKSPPKFKGQKLPLSFKPVRMRNSGLNNNQSLSKEQKAFDSFNSFETSLKLTFYNPKQSSSIGESILAEKKVQDKILPTCFKYVNNSRKQYSRIGTRGTFIHTKGYCYTGNSIF